MTTKPDFAKNLRLALATADMRQSTLAEHLEVSPAVVWQWANGRRPIPAHHAQRAAELLSVDPLTISESLAHATAKGLRADNRGSSALTLHPPGKPSHAEDQQKEGDIVIDEFMVSRGSPTDPEELVFVPMSRHISLPSRWVERRGVIPEKLRAFPMQGDAMAPSLLNGDIVVVDVLDDAIIDGQIYCFVVWGRALIRRLRMRLDRSVAVISDNPDKSLYPDEVAQRDELIVFGRAIYRAGELR
jgi:transcriptional regulator with XRE-family HTH domain